MKGSFSLAYQVNDVQLKQSAKLESGGLGIRGD
jgi:hypothetical protein